jgi:plasmid stabilization system protein ParE
LNIVITREAAADLDRLRAFLFEADSRAAEHVVAVVSGAIQSLDIFPDRGRPSKLIGARELIVPFGRSAYVIRYAHSAKTNQMVILRIWHGREART